MPLLRVTPPRFAGVADNAELAEDYPPAYGLAPGQCIDALAWDFRRGRAAQRPAAYGTLSGATFTGKARGMIQAKGTSYDKILVWNPTRIAHESSGAFVDLSTAVAGGDTGTLFQGANGLNMTLLPFGGTAALYKVVGGTPSTVGGTAPTGLVSVVFFRLSNRFLGMKAADDTLYYSAFNDATKWSNGDSPPGGSEPIGNERFPLTALAEGPGDMTTLFKADYVYIIERTSPANWNIRKKSGDRGAIGLRAWCPGPDGAVFFAHDSGIWMISGDGGVSSSALTAPIEQQWVDMIRANPSGVAGIGLAYDSQDRVLYALVPNDNSFLCRVLWRCYVPDRSWCKEAAITSGNTRWTCLVQGRGTSGSQDVFRSQEDATTPLLTVDRLDQQGCYNGAYIRTRPEGDPAVLKKFGVAPEAPGLGQNIILYLKVRGAWNVSVTVTVWEDDGTQTSFGPHTVSLDGSTHGRPLIAEVPCPPAEGKFIDVKLTNSAQDQLVDLLGFDVPYEQTMLGSRRA